MGVVLGLRANWRQFWLLVLVNAFVGAMVGLERTVLPLLADPVNKQERRNQPTTGSTTLLHVGYERPLIYMRLDVYNALAISPTSGAPASPTSRVSVPRTPPRTHYRPARSQPGA